MSYNMTDNDEEERKLYCGNLSEKVTEDLLYELFIQAGPLEKVNMPLDRNGSYAGYAFITFKHACSVPYAIELFEDTSLFGNFPKLRARNVSNHQRSQSMPIRFGQRQMDYDNGHNTRDFDSLLQMSTSMLNNRGQPMDMGPPMGRGPPRGHSMGRGPPSRREPAPPGEEEEADNDQPWNRHGDASRDNLSQSSLQGNWSARNSSHMLPDDNSKPRHQSRRDYDNRGRREHRDWDDSRGGGNWNDSGYRGYQGGYNQGGYNQGGYNQGGYNQGGYHQGGYDQGGYDRSGHGQGGYDQGGHNRNRNYGNHRSHRNNQHDDGYRSRSSDPRERKGRY